MIDTEPLYGVIYRIIIFAILILAIGFLLAYVIYRHYTNLVAIRDCFRSMSEDLEQISKDLKEINEIVEGASMKVEHVTRKLEKEKR